MGFSSYVGVPRSISASCSRLASSPGLSQVGGSHWVCLENRALSPPWRNRDLLRGYPINRDSRIASAVGIPDARSSRPRLAPDGELEGFSAGEGSNQAGRREKRESAPFSTTVALRDQGMVITGMEFPARKGGNVPAESPGKVQPPPLGLLISSRDFRTTQSTNSCSTGLNSRCLKVFCLLCAREQGGIQKGDGKDSWMQGDVCQEQGLTAGNGYGRKYSC